MAGAIIVILITAAFSFLIIQNLKRKYSVVNVTLLNWLFFYHVLLFFAYYGYASFNPSDSVLYYHNVLTGRRGDSWFEFYGTSTVFVEFIAYPFVNYLRFSYEATMALFAWFGYLGFIYFYIFFKENIHFDHKIFSFNMITLFFLLPNLHFWSASFGKGAVVFLGIGLFFFGVSNVRRRIAAIVIGGLIIYHVRPHILLVMLVSSAIGFVFSTKGISTSWRILFIGVASVIFFFIYKDVLTMVGINEDELLTEGLDLTHRAYELSKATSGVDLSSYSLPMQVFTFVYRPLFIDAPGALGLFVSFENAFYLMMTFLLLRSMRGVAYLVRANFLAKSAFFSFITISIALAQVSGNLGIAMRQKSQVMMLLLFFIISFLDQEKYRKWEAIRSAQKQKERLRKLTMEN